MLNNFKLTGTIHDDITTVCEAIEYTKSLIDGLVEESTGKMNIKDNPHNTSVFVDMLEAQSKAAQLKACSDHLAWVEKKRFYGSLAYRDYLFTNKYD